MTPSTKRAALRLLALTALAAVAAPAALAQSDFPNKPLRIIVPFPPGGASDQLARMAGQHLASALGQPVTVENKPGAGGNIGADAGAKAAPDGYTLLLAAAGFMAANPSIYSKLSYNSATDFQPVTLLVKAPLLLAVNPKVPAQNVREFIELAKREPGKVSLANGGTGTAQHLGGVHFSMKAGVEVNHVPYKGSAPATNDLLGGQVDASIDNLVTLVPHVKTGKVRALAVSSAQRVPALPDVPTLAESGLAGFEDGTWYGIVAPKGTPAPVVERLHAELTRLLAQPETKDKLVSMGLQPSGMGPADFGKLVASDIAKYREIVKAANVRAD